MARSHAVLKQIIPLMFKFMSYYSNSIPLSRRNTVASRTSCGSRISLLQSWAFSFTMARNSSLRIIGGWFLFRISIFRFSIRPMRPKKLDGISSPITGPRPFLRSAAVSYMIWRSLLISNKATKTVLFTLNNQQKVIAKLKWAGAILMQLNPLVRKHRLMWCDSVKKDTLLLQTLHH